MADLLAFVPSVIASLSAVGAGYSVYTKNDKDLTRRLTVVETKQANDSERLERIEDKLDRLIERD